MQSIFLADDLAGKPRGSLIKPGGMLARGSIEELPSGALRVSVYAGIDPLTRRRHYLKEIVPAGPAAAA